MSAVMCQNCQRRIEEGESAWADDWKVWDVKGQSATFRTEVRYTCDDCLGVTA